MEPVKGKLQIKEIKKGKEYRASFVDPKNGKDMSHVIQESARYFDEKDAEEGAILILELKESNREPKKAIIEGKPEHTPQMKAPAGKAAGGGYGGKPGGDARTQQVQGNRQGGQFQRSGGDLSQGASEQRIGNTGLRNATAPYNFIPYNFIAYDPAQVVEQHESEELYSGTLEVSLQSLTPLLVAGPQERNKEDVKGKKEVKPRSFLHVDGKPVIPGSSLKGMLRSLVEILSFAPMAPMNEKPLVFRSFDDETYKERIGIKGSYKPKAGWLERVGAEYHIHPVAFGRTYTPGYIPVKTGKVPPARRQKGMQDPHVYYFAPKPNVGTGILVSSDMMEAFKAQLSEEQKKQLTDRGTDKSFSKPCPVFYIQNGGGSLDFLGLPHCFRIPYVYKPKDLLVMDEKHTRHFAGQLFGFVDGDKAQKGRVRVGHCAIKGTPITPVIATLGQPSPTCIAHYIVQGNNVRTLPDNPSRNDPNSLMNYNKKDAQLRGRKYYWHRDFEQAKLNLPKGNDKTDAELHPMENCSGNFSVQVHNITLAELGALILALELPEGHAHKLGLGKPLGLGSVRLEITCKDITLAGAKYSSLLSRFKPCTEQLNETSNALCKKACEAFKNRVLAKLNKTGEDYEQLVSIKDLRAMMDFKGKPEAALTAYMPLSTDKQNNTPTQTYKAKAILPYISEVYGG